MELKKRLSVLLSIVFLSFRTVLFGIQVLDPEKIGFNPGLKPEEKLVNPRSLAVTNDDLFIITDKQSGNIKVYQKNGKILEWVNTIGRKGLGDDELGAPTYSFYNQKEGKFGVMDIRQEKIFIYDRFGRTDFKRVNAIPCPRMGAAIQLTGNKLLISGYTEDQNQIPYDLYAIDLKTNQTTYLLPSYAKYGLKSNQEYQTEYYDKPYIQAKGIAGWFDIQENSVINFIWEGSLKVINLNLKGGKTWNFEGTKTRNFTSPVASPELLEARKNKNAIAYRNAKANMSFVSAIFSDSKYIFVVYSKQSKSWLQRYTHDGLYRGEVELKGNPDNRMWFDKEKGILYSLSNSPANESEFIILKYDLKNW